MSLSHRIQEVGKALDDTRLAIERASSAADGIDPETRADYKALVKQQYEQLVEAFRLHNLPDNWRRDQTAKSPLHRYACFLAGQIVEDVINGRIPQAIEDLYFRPGRPGPKALHSRGFESIVRFLAAVDAGVIKERRSIEMVAGLFEVSARQVHRWASEGRADRKRQAVLYRDLLERSPSRAATFAERLRRHLESDAELYRNSRHGRTPKPTR